jgi:hypothetical protein
MSKVFKHAALATILLAAATLAGCGGNSFLTTGSNGDGTGVTKLKAVMPEDAPPGITNESPMARPASVAYYTARAKRCGFFFDPVKTRATYMSYESRQAGQELAKVEKVYDDSYRLVLARVTSDESYCTEARSADIRAGLARVLANDYAPNLPKPKMVADCGPFGCGNSDHKPIKDTNEFFRDQSRKTGF